MKNDNDIEAVNLLHTLNSIRHSIMMRRAFQENAESVDSLKAAIGNLMVEYLGGLVLLAHRDYKGFTEWFEDNTDAEIHDACVEQIMEVINNDSSFL